MGIFNVVDPVTGLTICQHDEVVAIMIERRTGGYPDPVTALAKTPISPNDIFEPASLPVFGKMGADGDIVPVPNQFSAALFQRMVGADSWKDAFDRATSFRDGGMAYPVDRMSAFLGQKEPLKEILGAAIFHRSTWDKIISMRWDRSEKASDVDMIMVIAEDLAKRSATRSDDQATMQLISLLHLRLGRRPIDLSDGSTIEVPRVASSLDRLEGGGTLSGNFNHWLTTFGPLGSRDARFPDRAVVEAIWDLQAFEQGLDQAGKMLLPSKSHGQNTNTLDVIETSLLAIQRAGEQIHQRAEDDRELRDWEVERLQSQIARIDELKERLEMSLSRATPQP